MNMCTLTVTVTVTVAVMVTVTVTVTVLMLALRALTFAALLNRVSAEPTIRASHTTVACAAVTVASTAVTVASAAVTVATTARIHWAQLPFTLELVGVVKSKAQRCGKSVRSLKQHFSRQCRLQVVNEGEDYILIRHLPAGAGVAVQRRHKFCVVIFH
jgi:hypothetical protein